MQPDPNHLTEHDDSAKLTGKVEADESGYGGRLKASMTRRMTMGPAQRFAKRRKVSIVAMVERDGNVHAYGQPRDRALETASLHAGPEALVYIDECSGYSSCGALTRPHYTIRHTDRVYASGDVHTQTIEGFFGNVKNGIAGNYHGVSVKRLQSYLNEYTWRYNHRYRTGRSMFAELLGRAIAIEP